MSAPAADTGFLSEETSGRGRVQICRRSPGDLTEEQSQWMWFLWLPRTSPASCSGDQQDCERPGPGEGLGASALGPR